MTKENVLRLYAHYTNINYVSAKLDMEKKRPWVLDSNAADTSKIDFKDDNAKKVSRAKAVPKVVK